MKDGDAHAIYYALFADNHGDKGLIGLVSLGEWGGDGPIPPSRVAFAFEISADDTEYKVSLIESRHSPWSDAAIVGRKLSRQEALQHPWLDDVFHITDHMTTDDPAIRDFFETVH